MLINMLIMVRFKFIYRETSPRHMSRLTNISAIEIYTICQSANKAYINVIEVCRKTVFVLSQLTCVNTYIKYVTEVSQENSKLC